jgi:hypothetical protein
VAGVLVVAVVLAGFGSFPAGGGCPREAGGSRRSEGGEGANLIHINKDDVRARPEVGKDVCMSAGMCARAGPHK